MTHGTNWPAVDHQLVAILRRHIDPVARLAGVEWQEASATKDDDGGQVQTLLYHADPVDFDHLPPAVKAGSHRRLVRRGRE